MRILFALLLLLSVASLALAQTTTNLQIPKPAARDPQPEIRTAKGFDLFDAAVAGRLSKSVAGGTDVTLTATEARNAIHEYTGLLTASINVIVPSKNKIYLVYNNTSGSYTLTVKTSGGTGIAVTQGARTFLYCDATNVVALSSSVAWSGLTDPSGNQSLAMGSNLTAWTWAGNYGSSVALDIQGNNTSASGALIRLRTAVSNNMPPLVIEPRTGQSFKADHLQSLELGKGNMGNTDTDGFPYLPVVSSQAEPSGTPTTHSGWIPVVFEQDNVNGEQRFWAYMGSAWRSFRPSLTGTASLNFGATSAQTCDTLTITVTGAATGDTVTLDIPNALATSDAGQVFWGWVSASDTVSVRRCNITGSALSDPSAATVRATVIKP